SWSFVPPPSPGEPNIRSSALTLVAAPVVLVSEEGRIKVNPPTKDPIRITTDGSPVNSSSPLLTDELWIGPGHVVRARSMPSNALSGPEAMITVQAGAPEPTYLSIAADPRALYNDTIGILAEGGAANFSRSGNEWQAPVLVEQNFGDTSVVSSLGLAVAGSGSRSLAKRSFKLFARDRFGSGGPIELPGSGAWYELFLRADATPHSFLRNMLVEQIVVLAGGHVDVQRSQPVPVYLNGVYQGLYRAMPPKNGAWLMDRSGAEAIDLVDGPGNHALRGSEDGLSRAIEALNRNAPIDSLAKWLDLQSLVDLASLDLYTGRADHDLNVRSWRSRTLEGRWRWIVFDMDLWAPMTENSLERMCSATALEAPYIPLLMGHPDLGPQLMARLEGLLATVLSPAYATELLDSLYNMHKTALERDHDRWAPELDQPTPQSTWEALRAHIQQRPNALMSHFGRYTGRSLRTVRLVRPDPKQGKLFIEDLAMTTPIATPQLLAGIPLRVSALASPGWEFAGWEGLKGGSPVRSIDPSAVRTIRPLFRKTAFRP
ncbi:MAG: CotH kinase family protein, partial [Flavobacteriales bacterium]|nr:CotH kinase family protein [Flavobacteriales bacterium]